MAYIRLHKLPVCTPKAGAPTHLGWCLVYLAYCRMSRDCWKELHRGTIEADSRDCYVDFCSSDMSFRTERREEYKMLSELDYVCHRP